MSSRADELRARVKRFATRVLKFVETIPRGVAADAVARQLARSGPSVSANYHSAGRARSRAEFISRLGLVADEADETEGWLDQLKSAGLSGGPELDWLLDESRELRAIFVQAARTARLNNRALRDRTKEDAANRRRQP
ncbi:MAG: four helix bundle protein [Acidobacteriota bacterium]